MANIAFSKIIRLSEHQYEFNFRKLLAAYPSYHADTTDLRGNRIQFSMHYDAHGNWHATGSPLPLWISDQEAIIGKVIEEETSLQLQK